MRWIECGLGLTNELGEVIGPPPPLDLLGWLYLKAKSDKTLERVCYQGVPDLKEWLNWYSRGEGKEVIANLGAWTKDGGFLGLGFINAIERKPGLVKAEVGFIFCREVSVFRQIDYMRAMISLLFLSTDITTILGTTPSKNECAVAMIRRLGLRLFGPVPNYAMWHDEPCSVWMSQTDKQHWFNLPENLYLVPDSPTS